MHYLYAEKQNGASKLIATFDSEQQLLAYVRWATLQDHGKQTGKFEQGSVLAGKHRWESTTTPPADDQQLDPNLPHNPSPSML